MKKYRKHSFTLIELLAVIGLLALLIGIFTPAFSRMMQGSQVDQTASKFKTGMEVAQAKAVASNRYVAMVIPSVADSADARLRPYCNGGYRLAYVKKDGSNWNFDGWVPGQEWSNMVDGAMLVRLARRKDWYNKAGKRDSGLKDSLRTEVDDDATGQIGLAGSTDSAFAGYGSLCTLTIPDEVSDEDIDALGSDNLRALIFSPYSGCVGGDTPLLFFFTEAVARDGSYSYPNEYNYLVLRLHPITGKVVYLAMEDDDE